MADRSGAEAAEPAVTTTGGRLDRWPNAWWLFLALGVAVVGLYHLMPDGLVLHLIYIGIGVLGVLAILVGTWLHRPPRPGAWAALAASQAFATLGDEEHYRQSYAILQSLNTTQTYLAIGLAALGLLNVLWAFGRLRSYARRQALPGVLR
jgi:hypothetical protein